MFRGPGGCKNIKKLFIVIQEYISVKPDLLKKYESLF